MNSLQPRHISGGVSPDLSVRGFEGSMRANRITRTHYKEQLLYLLLICLRVIQEKGKFKTLEWLNLTQMTIISTTVGRNPLEEIE